MFIKLYIIAVFVMYLIWFILIPFLYLKKQKEIPPTNKRNTNGAKITSNIFASVSYFLVVTYSYSQQSIEKNTVYNGYPITLDVRKKILLRSLNLIN